MGSGGAPEEELKEEGSRRKPLGGKLPSLGGGGSPIGSSSGGGKDLLPALRSSGLQPLGTNSAIAAASSGGYGGNSPASMDGLGSRMSQPAEAEASFPAGARTSSRSPESSPERSASPAGGSPAASSASRSGASRSAGSPSEVQEANDRSGMTASASEPGTPSQAGGSAGAKAAVEPFDAEESISIGSDDGSGDIDLSGRNGLNSSGDGGSSSLAAGRPKAAPASQDDDDNAVDEVEESISEDSFYVEGYQESEAKDSDNDKF